MEKEQVQAAEKLAAKGYLSSVPSQAPHLSDLALETGLSRWPAFDETGNDSRERHATRYAGGDNSSTRNLVLISRAHDADRITELVEILRRRFWAENDDVIRKALEGFGMEMIVMRVRNQYYASLVERIPGRLGNLPALMMPRFLSG